MSNWKPTPPPFRNFKRKVFKRAGSVSDFIYQIGESDHLRQPTKAVPLKKICTRQYKDKFKYLKNCLKRYRKLTGYGRGISAVQVGIPERFSVIYQGQSVNPSGKKDNGGDMLIIVNPKITKKSKKIFSYPEMCMSANPVIAPIVRPSWIEFEYYTEDGEKKLWDTKDDTEVGKMMNRVFQHEIDHLDGIINIDKVKDASQLILESDPKFYQNAEFGKVK
jgi:peptide deformylase